MKQEDLNSVIQIIESMELLVKELEKALEKRDAEKIKKAKDEILNLQRQAAEIIG